MKLLTPSTKPIEKDKDILLIDIDGVLCCKKRQLFEEPREPNEFKLRRDAVEMIHSLREYFNIYLLADLSKVPSYFVASLTMRLSIVGVMSSLEIRNERYVDYCDVFYTLGITSSHRLWFIKSLDYDLRSIKQSIQTIEQSPHVFSKTLTALFPQKTKASVFFVRNTQFDVEEVEFCSAGFEGPEKFEMGRENGLNLLASYILQQITREFKPLNLRSSILRLSVKHVECLKRIMVQDRGLQLRSNMIDQTSKDFLSLDIKSREEADIPAIDDKDCTR